MFPGATPQADNSNASIGGGPGDGRPVRRLRGKCAQGRDLHPRRALTFGGFNIFFCGGPPFWVSL